MYIPLCYNPFRKGLISLIDKEPILNINTDDIDEKLAMLFTAETTSLSIYRGWQKEKDYYLHHFKKISVFNFYTLNFTEWLKYKKLDFNTGYTRIEEFFSDFYGANNNIIDISFFSVDIPKLHSISNKDETYIIFCIQHPLLSFIKNNTFDDEFKFTLNKCIRNSPVHLNAYAIEKSAVSYTAMASQTLYSSERMH